MSDEDAASINTAVITCGQALYQSLGLPLPGAEKYGGYLLVYGGSTATGTLAVQYGVL
jgi:NADPH:quinone reductase-like Zn-dependent oxidoreductase